MCLPRSGGGGAGIVEPGYQRQQAQQSFPEGLNETSLGSDGPEDGMHLLLCVCLGKRGEHTSHVAQQGSEEISECDWMLRSASGRKMTSSTMFDVLLQKLSVLPEPGYLGVQFCKSMIKDALSRQAP